MDFSFDDAQEEVRALAGRILGDEVTVDLLREVEASQDRFSPSVWARLAQAGLLGIALPEDAGGGGLGIIEQCLVLEQVGRTLAPVPVLASIVMGAATIAAAGSPEQRRRWVAPAADGSVILTAALAEPASFDPLSPTTVAEPDGPGGGWRLTGVKTAVPAGPLADAVLVPATVDGQVGVFVVPRDAPGATLTRQRTTNGETAGYLELDRCHVGPDGLLGSLDDGAAILRALVERTAVGVCAMQLGVCEAALAMTADYTKSRVQFGRPIATFQAVGHRCADCYIDVEAVRLTLWQAAWAVSEGLPASTEVEVARFWAADAGHRVAHAAVHLHGGMGVATEYPLHRYFVWAKQLELMLGGATAQLLRIGAALAAEPV
ncbi:MAG: acyl-CoA/acyl-ACP dehydrogenase [Actinobacteria bacterium]|nr:acyl-CoA/acyl-ACP dehydrogenase [Actinomycetota bacterium]